MTESLASLQRWLLEAIVAGPAAGALVRERIVGDDRLQAEARLAVYAGGYRSRLVEAMRDEYPALRLLVGETVFDLFVRGYVASRPPRHFSLYALGAGFADYLAATRPADGGPLAGLPAALARLERARAEAGRAEGIERHSPTPLLADAALVPGSRLRLPDSVRLLRLDYDLVPLVEAADRGDGPVVPQPGDSPVALSRAHYRVRLHRLEPWQYGWLEALGPGGADVQGAALKSARASGRDVGGVVADLALWIPAASAAGLVVAA